MGPFPYTTLTRDFQQDHHNEINPTFFHGFMWILRGRSHRTVPPPSVGISGCNSEKKMVGHHLILNIIPNNFSARTERKVLCDRGIMRVDLQSRHETP